MARWLLFAIAVIANLAAIAIAVAPGVVTHAELPPSVIACASCTTPEVQSALARAAAIGRTQIQALVQSNIWLLVAVALVNVGVVGALVWMWRSNSTPHTDARGSSALNESPPARAGERGR